MIKSIIRISLSVMVTSVLLSSCAFLQKSEFADRKYYNFPRSAHFSEAKLDEKSAEKQPITIISDHLPAVKNQNSEAPIVTASAGKNEFIPIKRKLLSVPSIKPSIERKEVANTTSDVPVLSEKNNAILKFSKKRAFHPFSGSDGMFIIEILAAIFIPPIGVFLHDNGRTGTWFWVTFILCILSLCGWAFIFQSFVGLWFVAAILALLVVFDVL